MGINRLEAGTLPSVNDAVAGIAILATYLTRIASVEPGGFHIPVYLTIVTDVIIPIIAITWLCVVPTVLFLKHTRDS